MKTKEMTSFLVKVDDYHGISFIANSIIGQGNWKSRELGLDVTGHYIGLVYKGKRPTESMIDAALKQANINIYADTTNKEKN